MSRYTYFASFEFTVVDPCIEFSLLLISVRFLCRTYLRVACDWLSSQRYRATSIYYCWKKLIGR